MRLRSLVAAGFGALAVASCGAGADDVPFVPVDISTAVSTGAATAPPTAGTPGTALPDGAAAGTTPPANPTRTSTAGPRSPGVGATKTITGCDYPYPNATTYFSDGSTGWTRYCEDQMRRRVHAEVNTSDILAPEFGNVESAPDTAPESELVAPPEAELDLAPEAGVNADDGGDAGIESTEPPAETSGARAGTAVSGSPLG